MQNLLKLRPFNLNYKFMKKLIILFGLLFSASVFANAPTESQNAFKLFYGSLNKIQVEIAGKGFGHMRTVPGQGDTMFACFGGIPMYDQKSGYLVGYANDCLNPTVNEDGSVAVLPGFTFFDFFAPNGGTWTLMVAGNISVQPTVAQVDTKTAWGLEVTHITGSSMHLDGINNTVVGGSGPFDGAKGVSRISGMVNMSKVNMTDIPNSTLDFSCFFAIEGLELEQWAIDSAAASL